MILDFKDLSPRKQFLTLLLAYFGIILIKSILAVLGGLYWFPYFQNFLNSNAGIISIALSLLSLGILIKLYMGKEYGNGKNYSIGLAMMIAGGPGASIIKDIIKTVSENGHLVNESYRVITFGSILSIVLTIAFIVGVFMFINASPADRPLKVFVKCAPFAVSIIYSVLSYAVMPLASNYPQLVGIIYSSPLLLTNLAVFICALLLVRKTWCNE